MVKVISSGNGFPRKGKTMRSIAILLLVAAVCGLAIAESGRTGGEATTAEDVLRAYAKRVHTQVLPQAGSLGHRASRAAVSTIAAECLVPHKKVLVAKAESLLRDLPKLELGDRKDWEVVQEYGAFSEEILKELTRGPASSQPDGAAIDQDAFLLAMFWNPIRAASSARAQCLVRSRSAKEYGAVAIIEAMAPPIVYAVNADAKSPIVAFETGRDVAVVHLKLNDSGYYLPEKLEWLRKKAAP